MLAEREQDDYARDLIDAACERENICRDQLTIHADNGGVMRSTTVSELFDKLGVRRSHSRPYCSNDNPYSESQFKTLKYSAGYPERFDSMEAARAFIASLMEDYNHRMYHSGIAMLIPAVVHDGEANRVIRKRQKVLAKAYAKHPERFVRGRSKHQKLPKSVWIFLAPQLAVGGLLIVDSNYNGVHHGNTSPLEQGNKACDPSRSRR